MITIRPNLNQRDLNTVHAGKLGKKLELRHKITIECGGAVVRPSGLKVLRERGEKTVFAGLTGVEIPFILPSPDSPKISFDPRVDDTFKIKELPYVGGGRVSAVGWAYYLVSSENE